MTGVTHVLKTWPSYFQEVWDGKKTVEVTSLLHGGRFGVAEDHCVMSIRILSREDTEWNEA